MTAKQWAGGVFTNMVDQETNRLAGGNICYDQDGNMVSDQNGGGCGSPNYSYDVANRMVSAQVSGGTETYAYDAGNKRISKISSSGINSSQTIYIYGAMGEKLAVATAQNGTAGGGNGASTLISGNNVYFAERLIKQNTDVDNAYDNNFVAVDRLGSVRTTYGGGTASYLPYAEELRPTANNAVKFASYTRDASTGLDYADQRFYTSQIGRFMSADRFKQAAKANDSGSWNKYSYTRNDPTNNADPGGTDDCPADFCATGTGYGDDPYGGFDGGSGGQKGNPKNQGNDPNNQLATLGGAISGQQKQFQKAAQQAIALRRKSGGDCNKDFGGENGVSALDNAAFFYGTTDALASAGAGAAAQTNSSLNTIIISSIGWFFNPVQQLSNGTTTMAHQLA